MKDSTKQPRASSSNFIWRLPGLVFSWAAYWVGIVAFKLGDGIAAAISALRTKGSQIIGSIDDGVITVSVLKNGVQTWAGSEHMLILAFWLVAPPLVIWLIWLSGGARARAVADVPELLARGDIEEIRRRTREEELRVAGGKAK